MDDDLPRVLDNTKSRYPLFSGLSLISIPASCLISYLVFGNHAWLNAIALLIVPFVVFCWMFTTIKGIQLGWHTVLVHSIDLRHSDRRRNVVRHVRNYAARLSGVDETRTRCE